MSEPSKSPLASKTVWFNILTLLGAGIAAVADHNIVAENPVLVGGLAVASAVVNLFLRFATKAPIK